VKPEVLSGKRFTRNVLWNLIGTGLPMLVALPVIPMLIHGLGAPRFGILTLAWVVVGYFSLFDLGLGRAMTQLVAERLGRNEPDQVPSIVWMAMTLMLLLGVVGAGALGLSASALATRLLSIPPDLQSEALESFYLLAVSIPIVIGTTGLRGILEAHQRFDLVNIVRIPLGVATYAGPLAVLPFSHSLPAMVAVLVAIRFLSFGVYLAICLAKFPHLRHRAPLHEEVLRRMLTYGGFMTVSNVVGPLLLYLGRFVIAALVSAQAVAYFSTPYDVLANLLIVPGVFASVLFPAFTQGFQSDPAAVRGLYHRSLVQLAVVMLPFAAVVVVAAKPGLEWWINAEFSANGFRVAQIIAIGVFVNSFGHLSQALVQSFGRPDLTAKLHVLELVTYVPYLWWLIERFGIVGAALAWLVRVAISTTVLYLMARRCVNGSLAKRY
jgi:O-antigen/teichoic acid export membrane protein